VVEAADGFLAGDGSLGPSLAMILGGGELEAQAVRVREAENRLPEALLRLLEAYPPFDKPLRPVP